MWMQADRQSFSNYFIAPLAYAFRSFGERRHANLPVPALRRSQPARVSTPRPSYARHAANQAADGGSSAHLRLAARPLQQTALFFTDDPSIGAHIMAVLKGTDPTASGERPGTHPTAKAVPIPLQARPQPEVPVQLCREQRRYGALLKN